MTGQSDGLMWELYIFLLRFLWYANAISLPVVVKIGCKLGALEQRKLKGERLYYLYNRCMIILYPIWLTIAAMHELNFS